MRPEVVTEEQMRLLYSMDASLKRVSFGVTLWIVLTFLALVPLGLSLLGLLTMGG